MTKSTFLVSAKVLNTVLQEKLQFLATWQPNTTLVAHTFDRNARITQVIADFVKPAPSMDHWMAIMINGHIEGVMQLDKDANGGLWLPTDDLIVNAGDMLEIVSDMQYTTQQFKVYVRATIDQHFLGEL